MAGKNEKAVLTTVEVLSCEAHEVRFMCQERPRNQFSPLRRFSEARAGLFRFQEC